MVHAPGRCPGTDDEVSDRAAKAEPGQSLDARAREVEGKGYAVDDLELAMGAKVTLSRVRVSRA